MGSKSLALHNSYLHQALKTEGLQNRTVEDGSNPHFSPEARFVNGVAWASCPCLEFGGFGFGLGAIDREIRVVFRQIVSRVVIRMSEADLWISSLSFWFQAIAWLWMSGVANGGLANDGFC